MTCFLEPCSPQTARWRRFFDDLSSFDAACNHSVCNCTTSVWLTPFRSYWIHSTHLHGTIPKHRVSLFYPFREQLAEHRSPPFNILIIAAFRTVSAVPSLLLTFSVFHPLGPSSSSEQICVVISCPLHGFRLRPPSTLSQGDAYLRCPISIKLSLFVSLSIRTRCSFLDAFFSRWRRSPVVRDFDESIPPFSTRSGSVLPSSSPIRVVCNLPSLIWCFHVSDIALCHCPSSVAVTRFMNVLFPPHTPYVWHPLYPCLQWKSLWLGPTSSNCLRLGPSRYPSFEIWGFGWQGK